ncbi:DUF354 domain-containing protein [Natronococcus occultus]|uniref:DUF354 domain-containing protein n=1 Tax=Natronococcus occultus SP4 TaxID=694430 RepID=L0K2L5_9EURY|nr:DUF354 domain-containing protein [Natronococcus occultus]AGB39251.1 hypothetical protein Natoc_3526 [Natronococcus occultus SP4]
MTEQVVVTIQHPAHVHFFRNAIGELRDRGYDVCVLAREKDVACELLDHYGIDYRRLSGAPRSTLGLLSVQARYEYEILKRVRHLEPAAILGIGEPAVAHAGRVGDAESVLFTDTEHAALQNAVSLPLADRVYTPSAFWDEYGPHHRRYPGYHELAYLHPDRFDPVELAAVGGDRPLVVLRLVSWTAAHDVGRSGLDDLKRLVAGLERFGATVRISAEGRLPPALAARRLAVAPHRIHDLLASADLFLGESATMSLESALLGTPALYVSELRAGVLEDVERRSRLLRWLSDGSGPGEVLSHARELLAVRDSTWTRRRRRLLEDRIDTTALVVEVVEDVVGAERAEATAARIGPEGRR